jgi:hypothetical protein
MGTPSGGFGLISVLNKRTIRGPINTMDKSTVVSIYPEPIHEVKHTIQPGVFDIPAGNPEKPSVLVVGPSSWWKDLEENQPLLEIPTGSVIVAKSVVDDFCNGLLACNMGDAMPGLFWVEGAFTSDEIKMKHKVRLDDVIAKQRNWYMALCNMADALWSTSGGNPRVISRTMRVAAKNLGFEDKAWLKDFQLAAMMQCAACGNLRNPKFPVCPHCKAIDLNHPEAKTLKFAV